MLVQSSVMLWLHARVRTSDAGTIWCSDDTRLHVMTHMPGMCIQTADTHDASWICYEIRYADVSFQSLLTQHRQVHTSFPFTFIGSCSQCCIGRSRLMIYASNHAAAQSNALHNALQVNMKLTDCQCLLSKAFTIKNSALVRKKSCHVCYSNMLQIAVEQSIARPPIAHEVSGLQCDQLRSKPAALRMASSSLLRSMPGCW